MGPGQSPGRGLQGGEAPRSKTILSILNAFGELSLIVFLAYFSSLENRKVPLIGALLNFI